MLLPGCQISNPWPLFTVLLVTVAAFPYPYPENDKVFDLKVGFDLTNGEDGAPSLRIRDFEESREYMPRATEDDGEDKMDDAEPEDNKEEEKPEPPTAVRADSTSVEKDKDDVKKHESGEKTTPKESDSKEKSDSDDDEEESSEKSKHLSTRGPAPGEFDPEEKDPKIHSRDVNDEDDDDRRRRRRKRGLEKFDYLEDRLLKRKSKKVYYTPKKFTVFKRY